MDHKQSKIASRRLRALRAYLDSVEHNLKHHEQYYEVGWKAVRHQLQTHVTALRVELTALD